MTRSRKLPKNSKKSAAEIKQAATAITPQESLPPLISQYFANIGRKGGLKGGKVRAAKLSPKRRAEIAKKAAQARWSASKRA